MSLQARKVGWIQDSSSSVHTLKDLPLWRVAPGAHGARQVAEDSRGGVKRAWGPRGRACLVPTTVHDARGTLGAWELLHLF